MTNPDLASAPQMPHITHGTRVLVYPGPNREHPDSGLGRNHGVGRITWISQNIDPVKSQWGVAMEEPYGGTSVVEYADFEVLPDPPNRHFFATLTVDAVEVPHKHRPAFLVRVDEVLAGDKAGLLRYSVRERIEAAVEGAARRWEIDPAAVSVTEVAARNERPQPVMWFELKPGATSEDFANELGAALSPLHDPAVLERVIAGERDLRRVRAQGAALDEIEATTAVAPARPPWWRRALTAVCWWRE